MSLVVSHFAERARSAWHWRRPRAGVAGHDAVHTAPGLGVDDHSRDAEMILAVFRTVILVIALVGPRLFGDDVVMGRNEIALAVLAGVYNIGVGISCTLPRRYGLRRPFIVAMDILLVTVWIQFTANPALFPFFYIVVIMAALWFRVFGAVLTASFCNFFFLFLVVSNANDLELPLNFSIIALNTGLLFLVGCLVGYVSEAQEVERQRRLEDQLLIANYQREMDISVLMQPLLSYPDGAQQQGARRIDDHLEAGVAMQTATTLGGGDFFDVVPLPDGRTGLFIADVSGKSVRAQARLPLLKYALRALAPLYPEPAVLMARLNETLAPDLQPELFIALCCVVLDPEKRTLVWCNAGHIAPLLIPQAPENDDVTSGAACPAILPLETDGPALGMFPDTTYESRTLPWLKGDQLILFTDGLVDALSYGGSEDGEMQVKRLCARLSGANRQGAREEAQNFVGMAVAAFDAGNSLQQRFSFPGKAAMFPSTAQRDDVTVAVVRHRG